MARLADVLIDCAHPAALARFWAASLDGYAIAPYDDDELERLLHLDLRADDLDREVSRLTALGGTVLSDQPVADLVVIRDPEDDEFCVLAN